ncbi:hypothetical protein [Streptomyces sp. E-08]|uniref:hypothetical protein n=1 Tax=Streptomyces sp. E-08 TaxID=3404047 RepID=UPI003CE8BAC9
MSASEKSGQDAFPWTGPYVVPDYPEMAEPYDPDAETYAPTGVEEPSTLPAPLAEKAHAAAQAARSVGSTLWTAVRTHKAAATGGAVVGAAAALTLGYALGRRAGRRAGRQGLGPVALLLERRP